MNGSWKTKLSAPWRDRAAQNSRAARRRASPILERVEDRTLMSYTVGLNLTGDVMSDQFALNGGFGFIPPDTTGAIGPNHFVEFTNGTYSVRSKTTGVLSQPATSFTTFWQNSGVTGLSPAGSGTGTTDPRVIYDPDSSRWFALGIDTPPSGANRYMVAVSKTTDPTAGWNGLAVLSNSSGLFADYETIGIDKTALYIGSNNFLSGSFNSIELVVIPKADLLLASPTLANATLSQGINASNTGFTAQAVVDMNNGSLGTTPHPVLGTFSSTSVKLSSITGSATAPVFNYSGGINNIINVTNNVSPTNARQPGGPNTINTGDNRISGNAIKQGNNLWASNSISLGGQDLIHWYRIDATTGTLAEDGYIGADDATSDNYYPSISVNTNGDVVIGFTRSSATQSASTYLDVGKFNGTTTSFATPQLTMTGSGPYNITFGGARNRFGDYSETTLDPNDPATFWTIQEFTNSATFFGGGNVGNWQTKITQVAIAPKLQTITSTTADGTYGVNNTITLKLNFDLPVHVTGTPVLALNSGGTATYTSGSDTTSLTFQYTTAYGDTTNGSKLDALSVSGGTLKTISGVATADLTLPVGGSALSGTSNIKIDAVAPVVQAYKVLFGSQSFDLLTSTRVRLPWAVTGIQATFSKPITQADAASFVGIAAASISGVGTNTVTWNFGGPITIGSFATSLAGTGADAVKDQFGNALTQGSGFAQSFKVLQGDVNDDGVVNSQDTILVGVQIGQPYFIFADTNGDGVVDINDVRVVRKKIGTKQP